MTGPYLTRAQAAEYVGATPDAFDWWVRTRGVPVAGRRGRIRLFTRTTLDRVLALDAERPRRATTPTLVPRERAS